MSDFMWKVVGAVYFLVIPLCYAPAIWADCQRPEQWNDSFWHDPRGYVPVYFGTGIFWSVIIWADRRTRRLFEQLAGVKTRESWDWKDWCVMVFFFVVATVAPIGGAIGAHYEFQHPELWVGWHNPWLYMPAFAIVYLGFVAYMVHVGLDEKHVRVQVSLYQNTLLLRQLKAESRRRKGLS